METTSVQTKNSAASASASTSISDLINLLNLQELEILELESLVNLSEMMELEDQMRNTHIRSPRSASLRRSRRRVIEPSEIDAHGMHKGKASSYLRGFRTGNEHYGGMGNQVRARKEFMRLLRRNYN